MKKTFLNILLLLAVTLLWTACDSEGDKFDYGKVGLLITGTEQVPVQRFTVDELPASYAVTVKATRRCPSDVAVRLTIDTALVHNYNAKHGTAYYPVPVSCVTLDNSEVTIKQGEALSSAAQVKVISTDGFIEGATYVIPVTISQITGDGGEVIESSRTIFLQISRIISFYSLENNQNASSNYIFPDDKMVNLTNYTIEFKVYSYRFGNVGNIKRVLSIEGKNEEEANMFRFGENAVTSCNGCCLADAVFHRPISRPTSGISSLAPTTAPYSRCTSMVSRTPKPRAAARPRLSSALSWACHGAITAVASSSRADCVRCACGTVL